MVQKKGVVGVSVRDGFVRVLQLAHAREGTSVYASGKALVPEKVVVNGVVEDTQRLGEVIRQACDSALPHVIDPGTDAICALPESKTFVRIMSLPEMPDEQLAAAVRWEIEGYVPLPLAEVYYDWQRVKVLEKKGDAQRAIVVVASARTVVDGYSAALAQADLHTRGIEADSIADARAVIDTDATMQGGRMILFCGDVSSRLAIVVSGVPIFAVSVPVGYQTFVIDVSRALGVSMQEAQRMIVADGIGSYITKDPLFDAVLPSVRALSNEVRKSVDFCLQTLSQCKQVSSILICGKGATIKGLRAFLVKETGLPIYLANPWQGISHVKDILPPLSRTQALDAVTVIGLSSRILTYADFD